jgi:hypothetical protein
MFDFSYLGGVQVDLLIVSVGAHFAIYDPDVFRLQLQVYLPIFKKVAGQGDAWLLTGGRYCGVCHTRPSDKLTKGLHKGEPAYYLREIQNEARGELLNQIMMAEACVAGLKIVDQHHITQAIPVNPNDDAIHLAPNLYAYVLQFIAHFLPLTKKEEGLFNATFIG